MEIKPCPFGTGHTVEYWPVKGVGAPERQPMVHCRDCNIAVPYRIWNRRAESAGQRKLVEKWRKIAAEAKAAEFFDVAQTIRDCADELEVALNGKTD